MTWHRIHPHCSACGTTTSKYMARGLCSRCYLAAYRSDPRNAARIARSKERWYQRWTKEEQRMAREQKHFSGRRQATLERDGFRCTRCGSVEQLVVHHIDGNGRGSARPNNDPANLVTLCRACHAREHQPPAGWARAYDCCTRCGTTEIRHNAKGLCTRCYAKTHPTPPSRPVGRLLGVESEER